jgi:hypothetical protein
MPKLKILLQLDADRQVSTFDSVVAIDAGVDQLFRHAEITIENVQPLVHGAMFTRGGDDLKSTAIFVGGSDVQIAEAIMGKVVDSFFGAVRVSVMADPNGANTTAAAAVICAEKHVSWYEKTVVILGGSGPVGQRIAQIIGKQSESAERPVSIRIVSRSLVRAEEVCQRLQETCGCDRFDPQQALNSNENLTAIKGADVIFAAGAAGIELLPEGWMNQIGDSTVAVDLNAVPPSGIYGIEPFDRAQQRGRAICYGAIGVVGIKMKIHKRCLQSLFESNNKVLEVDQIYRLGRELVAT